MKFNFDEVIERRNTDCLKYDAAKNIFGTDDAMPMWIADMDFETAPAVKEAIVRRAEHGIFGYSVTPSELFSAASAFWGRRHGFAPPTEWMV